MTTEQKMLGMLRRCHDPVVECLAIARNNRKMYEGYRSRERRYDTEISDLERLLAEIEEVLHADVPERTYEVGQPCGVCASGTISSRGGHRVCANCGWNPPGSWTQPNTPNRG